jgi:hypothetical protein
MRWWIHPKQRLPRSTWLRVKKQNQNKTKKLNRVAVRQRGVLGFGEA